jgi:hypothetical protein
VLHSETDGEDAAQEKAIKVYLNFHLFLFALDTPIGRRFAPATNP